MKTFIRHFTFLLALIIIMSASLGFGFLAYQLILQEHPVFGFLFGMAALLIGSTGIKTED